MCYILPCVVAGFAAAGNPRLSPPSHIAGLVQNRYRLTTDGACPKVLQSAAVLKYRTKSWEYRMQNERIDRVFKPVIDYGDLHYGEAVTQLEHALQCAQLAREQGGSPALIAAALLHDVGQFIDDAGNAA